jgi:lysophospholipase L1-like esterase
MWQRSQHAKPGGGPRRMALATCLLLLVFTLMTACAQTSAPRSTTVATPTPVVSATVPADTRPVYVAIGASDAFGVGTNRPDRDNWPTVLAGKLGSLGTPVHLINLGIPGALVSQANRDELPIAIDATPDIVTVFLGVNDLDAGVSLPTYIANLRSLLVGLSTQTTAQIFVGNLPDLTLLPYFAHKGNIGALRAQVAHWNDAIATLCKQQHAVLVDLFSTWGQLADHPEYIASDGFHPSTAGAAQLAGLFEAAIVGTVPSLR